MAPFALCRAALSHLLDVLSPPGCLACDAHSPGRAFCARCGSPYAVDGGLIEGVPLIVAGAYAPPLSSAVVRFKFQNRPELARPLSRLLEAAPSLARLPSDAVLAPVPLHPRRLAERGYNQAALLAQELARACRRPCQPLLLRRSRETSHQVGKSRDERRDNAAGAITLRRRWAGRVVLVDDVVTTGSTVRACARALASGGVELCAVVALAYAAPSH